MSLARFSHEQLRALLAALPDPAFVLTRSGRYAAVFGGTDSRYYHDGGGLVGLNLRDVLAEEKADWFIERIVAALADRAMHIVEYGLAGRDVKGLPDDGPADTLWFEGRLQALDFPIDGEDAVLWIASNITARHRMAEERAETLRREREASFRQRQFIGVVSHEFRTPLALIDSVLTNIDLVPPRDPADLARRMASIAAANNRLVQLTDTCLADARAGEGLRIDERRPVDLAALLREAAAIVEPDDGAWLRPTPRMAALPAVAACPSLLRSLFTNLLDNARKYAPGHPVEVDAAMAGDGVRLRFIDLGPGIAEEEREAVFARFVRGRDSNTVRGTGLGLYISREIARAHGGELRLAESGPGGSVFELSLPRAGDGEP